jgi:hypothetical protein
LIATDLKRHVDSPVCWYGANLAIYVGLLAVFFAVYQGLCVFAPSLTALAFLAALQGAFAGVLVVSPKQDQS